MTDEQQIKCHATIHAAATAAAAAGAGLAQVPMADKAIIVPIQVAMTIALGEVFGVRLSETSAKAALATGLSTMVGRGISQWLVGWIPGWGNALNATTAFGVTEMVGWVLAADFDRGA